MNYFDQCTPYVIISIHNWVASHDLPIEILLSYKCLLKIINEMSL